MSQAPSVQASASATSNVLRFIGKYGTLLFLALLILFFAFEQPGTFPTYNNAMGILDSIALTGIVAGGQTMALIVGEFDLSVGAMASLGGIVVAALLSEIGVPLPLAILGAVAVGALVGLFNGVVITKLGVNSLITTLGTSSVLVAINYYISGGTPLTPNNATFSGLAIGSLFASIPNDVICMAVVLIILWIVLNRTDYGVSMQAVGGNPEAARMSGILNDRTKIMAMCVSGVCAAFAGVLLASRLGSGEVTAGDTYLLDSMAAAFLGSAVLRDGEFHIFGTFVGALTVGVGFNGILLLGLPTYFQEAFRGVILLGAVALGSTARRYAKK